MSKKSFRVVTYNVHKCRGLDGLMRPDRIVKILRDIDADVVALQEVLSIPERKREEDQVSYIAEELNMRYVLGQTRTLKGGAYGNVVLTRFPIIHSKNYDISVGWREQRGCLRTDLEHNEQLLHVFNVHFGTDYLERRRQIRKMVDSKILHNEELHGVRIVLGDFNEWTRGLASRVLSRHLESADVKKHLNRTRTYPGILPLLHLDHIYFDRAIRLLNLSIYKSRTALVASDHLPLVADFEL